MVKSVHIDDSTEITIEITTETQRTRSFLTCPVNKSVFCPSSLNSLALHFDVFSVSSVSLW